MSKFILINKPAGPTSHDIINQLRKITAIKKIGHAGTLDPFAEGLLLVAIGRESTREISKFVGLGKEYVASLKLGAVSNTYDKTGDLRFADYDLRIITKERIAAVIKNFIGEIEQTPPMFSAKKFNGQKLYQLARQGKEIERKPCRIKIYDIRIKKMAIENCILEIEVHCSSGTYIRALAHDIGEKLGCGAYLERLVRTKIGFYDLKDSYNILELTESNWQEKTFE